MTTMAETLHEAYTQGFLDGLEAFAWMKDGVTYVGTTGKTLSDAQQNLASIWNYHPERMENL